MIMAVNFRFPLPKVSGRKKNDVLNEFQRVFNQLKRVLTNRKRNETGLNQLTRLNQLKNTKIRKKIEFNDGTDF